MNGTVLHFDQQRGILRGDDQQRYYFLPADWLSGGSPLTGQRVDFMADGQNAHEVFLQETAPNPTGAPPPVYLPTNPEPGAPSVPSTGDTQSFLKSFLSFDKMIAPTLISILYYILLAGTLLGGLISIAMGLFVVPFGGNLLVGWGLLAMVLGTLYVRLFCEFFIVIFKIHTRLRSLDEKTADTH